MIQSLKRDALRIIAMSCISDYDEQGADVDGFVAKVEAGNHGQVRGDLLFGKRYFDRAVGWSRWLRLNNQHPNLFCPKDLNFELPMPEEERTQN